jgi:hypothetical protein
MDLQLPLIPGVPALASLRVGPKHYRVAVDGSFAECRLRVDKKTGIETWVPMSRERAAYLAGLLPRTTIRRNP